MSVNCLFVLASRPLSARLQASHEPKDKVFYIIDGYLSDLPQLYLSQPCISITSKPARGLDYTSVNIRSSLIFLWPLGSAIPLLS